MMEQQRATLSKMENALFVNRKCPQRITGSKQNPNSIEYQKQTGSNSTGNRKTRENSIIIILECNIVKSSINIFSWSGTPLTS